MAIEEIQDLLDMFNICGSVTLLSQNKETVIVYEQVLDMKSTSFVPLEEGIWRFIFEKDNHHVDKSYILWSDFYNEYEYYISDGFTLFLDEESLLWWFRRNKKIQLKYQLFF
jgi:hypothetical protein